MNVINLSIMLAGMGLLLSLFLLVVLSRKKRGPEGALEIAALIRSGTKRFLRREMLFAWLTTFVLAILLALAKAGPVVANSFIAGASATFLIGVVSLFLSTRVPIRTALAAENGLHPAFIQAFSCGTAEGLLTGAAALSSVSIALWLGREAADSEGLIEAVIGLALGGTLASLIIRVAGGFYFSTAGLEVSTTEISAIPDFGQTRTDLTKQMVDHVSRVGMATNLFANYLVVLAMAIWLARNIFGADSPWLEFPLLVGATALAGSILGFLTISAGGRKRIMGTFYSGLLAASLLVGLGIYFLGARFLAFVNPEPVYDPLTLLGIAGIGLVLLLALAVTTEFYTSKSFAPTRQVAFAANSGHASNVIAGLAVGMQSTVIPIFLIGASMVAVYYIGDGLSGKPGVGLFAIAIAGVVLVSMTPILSALDAFGPVAGSAARIATLGQLSSEAFDVTLTLNSAGHQASAVAGGYGLACVAWPGVLAMVGFTRAFAQPLTLDLSNPLVLTSILAGGLIPYLFSGHLLKSLGKSVAEGTVRAQAASSATGGVSGFIVPALLLGIFLLAVPVAIGGLAGKQTLVGFLLGVFIVGIFQALALVSGGSVWDSARRYIEDGRLGGLRSKAHMAALTGDSVGGYLKDSTGSALGLMVESIAIVALATVPHIQ